MRRGFHLLCLTVVVTAIGFLLAPMAGAAEVRVHVDVRVEPPGPQTEQLLADAGLEIELAVPELSRWQGWLDATRIDELLAIDGVVGVQRPLYASFAAGSALTEGDEALNASLARTRFNVDGSGIRVAVISDGIKGLEQAQRAGEAPKLVDARAFGAGDLNRGQEGTVMIEIVHDLAPGAEIFFAAVTTDLDHIAAVNHYARYVDIIVDDVSYAFPADQRSDVSVNTTRALEHPNWPLRLYVTAAGNWAESHWAGAWQAGVSAVELGLPLPGTVQSFSGASQTEPLYGAGNGFRIEQGDHIRLALFWDDDWGGSTNDYDLYLMSGVGTILASSETRQGIGILNHYPREHLEYVHEGEAIYAYVVIQNHNDDAGPVHFDLFAFHFGGVQLRLDHRTAEGSILAQSDADGALTVGAVNVGQQMVAPYSSRGPTVNGVFKPEITAVDRVTVSDTTHFAPRFSGSSAAAPHVAGVAALLLEAQPALLSLDGGNAILERRLIREILIDTAVDIAPAGPDMASGAGLINADAALDLARESVAIVTSEADSGPGTLRQALLSGAGVIIFRADRSTPTIVLESPLPAVPARTILDGTGWSIDASAVDVGLELGDSAEVWGLTLYGANDVAILLSGHDTRVSKVETRYNQVGILVAGSNAHIEAASIVNSASHGIVVGPAASASISASMIERNRASGVSIDPAAGDVLIGPFEVPPLLAPASESWTPIGPIDSAAIEPRTGRSHRVVGTVSIDGLPAPTGTSVDIYLDRRLAASVSVDDLARFSATVIGPGAELRFAVNSVAIAERLDFAAGADSRLTLRATTASMLVSSNGGGDLSVGANLIRDNQVGIDIRATPSAQTGRRFVWGNRMQGNRSNISSTLSAPVIEDYRWSAAGLNVSGTAPHATIVHLYAGPHNDRRFAAAVPVVDARFRFADISVDSLASEFSIIGHGESGHATSESEVLRLPAQGEIIAITPDRGYVEGGESVQICGSGLATDAMAPRVWFGNQQARVAFWSEQCVTVTTPADAAGPTDIALLLTGQRPIVVENAFEYRAERIVRLRQGWNFVTWSGPTTRITNALAPLAGATLRVYSWDSNQQQWRLFSTSLPPHLNTLRTISHDQPLWIFLDSPDVDWHQPSPD